MKKFILFVLIQLPLFLYSAPAATPQIEIDKAEIINEVMQEKTDNFGAIFMKMIVLLTITVVALVIIAWFAKRFLQTKLIEGNQRGRIQITEKRVLSPKSVLYVIKIDNQELLISEHTSGIQKLQEISSSRSTHRVE